MAHVVQHPAIKQRLFAEVDGLVPAQAEAQLPPTDLVDKLPFLTQSINESMRLKPAVGGTFSRNMPEPRTINGYRFPAGVRLSLPLPSPFHPPFRSAPLLA